MTRMRHKPCKGTGMVWARLHGDGPDGKPIDDGELHTVRCAGCEGAGYVDGAGRPWHERKDL